MVHSALSAPASALWLYVFVVIILLVLSWVSTASFPQWDRTGNMKIRGGLGFLIIAIILGIIVYFLVAADIQQWAWFVALLPTAILLFCIYFAFFAVFGQVMFWIGSLLALFVMIWLVYYAFVNQAWSLLAFPVIYLILVILGGVGMASWRRFNSDGVVVVSEEIYYSEDGEEMM